jgi:hypothetical protein
MGYGLKHYCGSAGWFWKIIGPKITPYGWASGRMWSSDGNFTGVILDQSSASVS